MTGTSFRNLRGSVGKGDLLRMLAVSGCGELVLDHTAQTKFAYVHEPPPPPPSAERPVGTPMFREPMTPQPSGRRPPLDMSWVVGVVAHETLRGPGEVAIASDPIEAAHAAPRVSRCMVSYETLIPLARLLPALRRFVGAMLNGAIDVERLTQHLASHALPKHLPRRQWHRWHPGLIVLLDFSLRLRPFHKDFHHLARSLLQRCGRSAVSLRLIEHGPLDVSSNWIAEQTSVLEPERQRWRAAPRGTPVLIASDLGLLCGAGSREAGDWRVFIRKLRDAAGCPVALAPLGNEQIPTVTAQLLPILRWSPDARLHPMRGHGEAQALPSGLKELLAMLATARRVDPPLLRALRRLNPVAPLNAGLEGAAWCHADVDAEFAATVRPGRQQQHLQYFAEHLPELHFAVHQLRLRHHAHLRRLLEHEETLLWAAHAGMAARTTAAPEIEAAKSFMRQIPATTWSDTIDDTEKQRWRQVAAGIVARAESSPAMVVEFRNVLLPLKDVAAGHREPQRAALHCWIVYDTRRAQVVVQAELPGTLQYSLGGTIWVDAQGLIERRTNSLSQQTRERAVSRGELPLLLDALENGDCVELESAVDRVTLGRILRPHGVQRWWCGARGIEFKFTSLCGVGGHEGEFRSEWPTRLQPQSLWANGPHREPVPPNPVLDQEGRRVGWRLMSGERPVLDRPYPGRPFFGFDEFGLYADLLIAGRYGHATQRFRRIEPGMFLMGSPGGEPERREGEGPQHRVTLSRGFWLADTACTQELWIAVKGLNPSRFKGPQLPVENVSWHDVQGFLLALDQLLPEFHAALPTEAEWEYACRAGTTDPFSFGKNITPAQVNYGGNYPYAGAARGEDRRRTVPVKSLPANPWGLYEMHGNVWEWCADGLRKYGNTAVTDPVGAVANDLADRALRGGSWIYGGRFVRSAARRAGGPSFSLENLGFRVCSRSSQSAPVLSGSGGLEHSAHEARAESPSSPEPQEEARRKNFWQRLFSLGE